MTAHPNPHSATDRRNRRARAAIAVVVLAMLALVSACSPPAQEPVTIGLITKQEENPFWVTMREVAEQVAAENDVTLLTATGESDADVASQEAAIEDMVSQGVDGILIAPTDPEALLPAIEAARDAGVTVIALDTPVEPTDAVDGFFGTDNYAAGRLVGEYAAARAADLGLEPRVVTLDLVEGVSSGVERHEGFLAGFGIDEEELVASAYTEGDRELAAEAMAEILGENPDVNVVFTVNEPAAFGAAEALADAGADMSQVVLVSVDGGCEAIKDGLRTGLIDATAQQYPENMAREGVLAIAALVRDDVPVPEHLDTGLQLIASQEATGVESRNVEFGVRNCWG